ncbi:MAG: 16S rRNA (cytosine(1402)-N(4))-methyltransferase RsmH [Spirochaetota bacterium]
MGDNPASFEHYPVLYREVLEAFTPCLDAGSTVVDCTLGGGGHSRLMLEAFPGIRIIAFERDARMIERARKRLGPFVEQCDIIHDNFSELSFYLSGMEGKVSAILYDFGISSFHLDADDRGFSIKDDAPLDMRLDASCTLSAADVVNDMDEGRLADIIYTYGEERHSRKIARRIVEKRQHGGIRTTGALADIVLKAVPLSGKKRRGTVHPATRTFQALRIFVNNELDSIRKSLESSWTFCRTGGRICAISFHSLEDRIVKQAFRSLSKGCYCDGSALCTCDRIPRVALVTKKPVVPGEAESAENPRSRSAKMRVCERV